MKESNRSIKMLSLFAGLAFVVAFVLLSTDTRTLFAGPAAATDSTDSSPLKVANLFGISETGLYIVRFADPALASYMGGKAGLEATSPQATGARKLDPNTPASQAYVQYLNQQHSAFTAVMNQTLGRSVEVTFDYVAALNGMAVRVSHEEAALLAALPGVAAVYGDTIRQLETDEGPLHIGAPAIWDGETSTGVATRGEGLIIGVIDSGINSQHPSFAATDGDGYAHTNPYGPGTYRGWCIANPAFCNDKLIGAYGLNPPGGDPEDTDGHGSHTASTAGGNWHDAVFTVGADPYTLDVSGVASRANIVAYKVCNPGCPAASSIAAVNHAIQDDGADVLNYSISGSDNPWVDPVDLAFLEAFNAGIFVSASAGNAGPGPSTVAKTGPWNAAVAASTINRVIANTFDITAPTSPPDLQGLAIVPGEGTAIVADISSEIRFDPTNPEGCTPFPPGFFANSLALIQRGSCTFVIKVNNAAAAGAIGVVVFNHVGGPPITMGGLTGTPPAVFLDLADGTAVRDYILTNPPTSARINAATAYIVNDDWEDIVAGFSSRGPSQFEILKPDYIAPGVNILAAVASAGGNPVQYGFAQGTSMAAPHGAGAAALMMALQPTWSPAEVKSALATGAVGGLLKEDGATPADPFDIGSGLLALDLASTVGLVFDETHANYVAANPAIGGDPKTLNQPSVVNYACSGTCTWTRTVESVVASTATYTAVVDGPAGMNITVTPSTFTLAPGATQVLVIEAEVSALPSLTWAFGAATLETDAVHSSGFDVADTIIPVVVRTLVSQSPEIEVDPTALTSTIPIGGSDTQQITISNNGDSDLNWTIFEAPSTAAPSGFWFEDFDSYPLGHNMHGVNGWRGWNNDPAATAFVTDAQARSAPHSIDIVGDADLVREYSGVNSGQWTYTAWQYVPSAMTGLSYFIMLNTYVDNGPQNWSVQVTFNAATNLVSNTGVSGGTLPLIEDQWVEIRLEIDLDADTQEFYYDNQLLYAGTWTDEVSGSGMLNIAVVDLFANGASSVYYDDMSLTSSSGACAVADDIPWVSASPDSGVTTPGGSATVDVTFDATGLTEGTYEGTLCVESDDPDTPIVPVSLTLNVEALAPEIDVDPTSLESAQVADTQTTQTLTIANVGLADLDWTIEEAAAAPTSHAGQTVANSHVERQHVAAPAMPGQPFVAEGTIVADGSFEAGSPNPVWNEFSSNFGTPLCDAGCGGPPAHTGSWYAWFGGTSAAEIGSVDQDVTIPAGAAELSFWLLMGVNSGASGFLEVQIDDNVVFSVTEADVGDYGDYTLVTVDVSAFADGGVHNLEFYSEKGASPVINFFVDDIAIETTAGPGPCDIPDDIAWLTVSPDSGTTVPGDSTDVAVTFDSTGLSTGVYTGTLCINSNDPVMPLVTVPVTLTVVPVSYGVEVAAEDANLSGEPGSSVEYTLWITNTGSVSDTFDLSVSGNIWTTTPDVANVTLDAGAGITVTVTVDIPGGAEDGDIDTVVVTATSQTDGTATDSATLTTTAVEDVEPPTDFLIYLPVIMKP